jgi:hypothetical protein
VNPGVPARDEIVFVVSQYAGIICGLIVSYWLILRLKGRMREWYDEKQWRDITRTGFTTLLMRVPSPVFFFAACSLSGKHYATACLWFPFALFLILLLFSFFILLNYGRD